MKKFAGLTTDEVVASLEKHGSNALTEIKSETFWQKLLGSFRDPIIQILIVALIVQAIFAVLHYAEWYEVAGIAGAVLLATLIGTWSEYSNENAFQKLQAEASQILIKTYRNGQVVEVPIEDLVVGDEILLQTGDKIPADGFLLDGKLDVDQAALNGESDEAEKLPAPADEKFDAADTFSPYSLFRSSVVTAGEAVMKLTKVGDGTFFGKLARELETEERDSPLKTKLTELAKIISHIGYIGGTLIFLSVMADRIFIAHHFNGTAIAHYFSDLPAFSGDLVDAFILAVIIIVVAVPEGLPMMIAMVLSQNMRKMLRDNILVRKMEGIETAGSLNILFSDKTGTITKGQLEVVQFLSADGTSYDSLSALPEDLRAHVQAAIVENTAARLSADGQVIGGNMTDKALLTYAGDYQQPLGSLEIIESIPFSSATKFSAAKISGNWTTTLVKGAPEKILPNVQNFYDGDKLSALTSSERAVLDEKMLSLAGQSMRLLALATTTDEMIDGQLPSHFDLIGILAIRDDVRPEAVAAIAEVQAAGVQVVMITGDRKETAVAIARDAKILQSDAEIVLTSQELNEKTDEEVKGFLPNLRVVARALPTDKSRLVRLSQQLGLVVGMTGDGVNDSPALKQADVGFAMGSGTEVAKEAGDIVILDDNFKSIERSILFGRTIYRSIQKFIVFQLTMNVGALLISFISPFIGITHPITITQMLWINLVMDTLAALAFGSEPPLARYMKERPKKRTEAIVTPKMSSAFILGGVVLCAMGLILLTNQLSQIFPTDSIALYTGFFSLFILYAVVNGFNVRTEKINIFDHLADNKMFLLIMAIIVAVQVLMTFVGGAVLRTTPLSSTQWLVVVLLALCALPIDMLRKLIVRNVSK